MSARILVAAACLLCQASFAANDYPAYAPGSKLDGTLRIVEESTAEPLMKLWIDGFTRHHPALKIIARATSPLAAVPTVASGAYDLGFPARELWPFEEELFRKTRGHAPTVVLVGLGAHRTVGLTPALGVFVNARNSVTRISLDELDALYSRARLRGLATDVVTWGDLGATGEQASRPVHAYIHRLPNGIDYFIQNVVTLGAEFKPSVLELPMRRGDLGPDEVIAQAVAGDPDGIGFACVGSVIPGVKTLAVARTRAGPYLEATLDDVRSMRYPLARPIYLLIDRVPGQPIEPRLQEFIRYVLSEGQGVFGASGGWLPLPPAAAAAELAKVK